MRNTGLFKLACVEFMRILCSSKCLILILCFVFLNINIIDPIRALSHEMGMKVSFLEPFVALSNSSLVLLVIPLLFIVMMSEFPDSSGFQFFYSIRMSRLKWVVVQLLCICISVIVYITVILLYSIVMSVDFISFNMSFSDAVRYYGITFPEREFSYVSQLFPLNMLNQLSLLETLFYSLFALYLYLLFLFQMILFFSMVRKKIVGIALDFMFVFMGATLSSAKSDYQWIFPLAHSVSWNHFNDISSVQTFPVLYSVIYLIGINLLMTILIVFNSKKVRPE